MQCMISGYRKVSHSWKPWRSSYYMPHASKGNPQPRAHLPWVKLSHSPQAMAPSPKGGIYWACEETFFHCKMWPCWRTCPGLAAFPVLWSRHILSWFLSLCLRGEEHMSAQLRWEFGSLQIQLYLQTAELLVLYNGTWRLLCGQRGVDGRAAPSGVLQSAQRSCMYILPNSLYYTTGVCFAGCGARIWSHRRASHPMCDTRNLSVCRCNLYVQTAELFVSHNGSAVCVSRVLPHKQSHNGKLFCCLCEGWKWRHKGHHA